MINIIKCIRGNGWKEKKHKVWDLIFLKKRKENWDWIMEEGGGCSVYNSCPYYVRPFPLFPTFAFSLSLT